jgi:hypothetical protein
MVSVAQFVLEAHVECVGAGTRCGLLEGDILAEGRSRMSGGVVSRRRRRTTGVKLTGRSTFSRLQLTLNI